MSKQEKLIAALTNEQQRELEAHVREAEENNRRLAALVDVLSDAIAKVEPASR